MSQLPDYVASATPNPKSNRLGWLTTTAASYAGVMLWFAFWQDVPNGNKATAMGGILAEGLPLAIISVIIAAFLCYFLCYLVPGMLGMKTGLSLSVVGTSTFGVKGGLIMPGFLMGVLQFGWLSVNAYFAGLLLAGMIGFGGGSIVHHAISVAWILGATFVGMKGVKYVGAVASFTPILPLIVLAMLLVNTVGGLGSFESQKMMSELENKQKSDGIIVQKMEESDKLPDGHKDKLAKDDYQTAQLELTAKPIELYGSRHLGIIALACAYIVGFFATAGAAGVGFGSNNKDAKSIHFAGLVGIVLVTTLTAVVALVTFAGTFESINLANVPTHYRIPKLLQAILGTNLGNLSMLLLALAAFPSACFPTVVAADAFKTTFPKINPLITCGLGVLAAIFLSVSELAGRAGDVFTVVGASFGPICGAMIADYLLAGKRWAGPRIGFNAPGWIAWFFGFIVGAATLVVEVFLDKEMPFVIPCPPVAALLTGFVLYLVFAKLGMESKVLPMPQRIDLDGDVPAAE